MAYIRTILKGSLGAVEVWSTSTNWGIFGIHPDSPDQALVDGILARLITYTTVTNVPASFKTLLSSGSSITGWRVELRGENELTLSVAEGLLGTPVTGGGSASKTPQDAVVFSLRTSTPGPRGRGRMYFPAVGASLSAAFQLTGPSPAGIAADAKTWLNAIGSQMNAYFASISSVLTVVLSVRSQTDHVCRNVNQIQVGAVLDTQRRRRDSLPETYASVSYP